MSGVTWRRLAIIMARGKSQTRARMALLCDVTEPHDLPAKSLLMFRSLRPHKVSGRVRPGTTKAQL